MKRSFSLVVFLLLITISGFSQRYYFESYGVKQGLSNSDVYAVTQDDEGYIWLGTKSGISRFDGKSFINYYSEEGTAPNGMKSICQDTAGGIWFGHIGGGLSYYLNGKFENRSIDSLNSDIVSIVEDEFHRIWIATVGKGVYRIDNPYQKDTIYKIAHYAGAEGLSDIILSISMTKSFGLLFVMDIGVKYYDEETQSFEFIKNKIIEWPRYFQITTILEDTSHTLWVGTFNGGLYQFMNNGKDLKVFDHRDGLAKNWISYLYEDDEHAIWVGTWGGGVSVIRNDKFQNFNDKNGLDCANIRAIYQDFEGNVIIGSRNNGLFIYKGDAFINYTKFYGEKPIQVNAVYQTSKGKAWFGSSEGIWVVDFNKDNVPTSLNNLRAETIENLYSNDIRFILPDENNNLWIATWGGGVSTFYTSSQNFDFKYRLNRYVSDASSGNVSAMTIGYDNDLYVGASEGLVYYEINTNKIDFLTQTNGLAGNDITALYTSSDGKIWIGSRNKGLTTIEGSTISIVDESFKFTPTCFAEDSKLNIWIGTEGQGIIVVSEGKIVKKYTAKDGLSSGMITTLMVDSNDDVFIGTPNELYVYDKEDKSLHSYGEKEGFIGIDVRPNSTWKTEDNKLWFGTVMGVSLLRPNKLRHRKIAPKVSITRVRVELEDQDIYKLLKLDYTQNSILIDYKGISLVNSGKVHYKVKLEGADHDWQPITNQSFANYPSLSPGNYTFKVLAVNSFNIWNENPATFRFIIKPPFWQTIWFYIIVLVILIGGIVAFIRFREHQLLQEKAALEQKVNERTVEIRDKNKLLAKKNKDITDSINYARRIQTAMMPSDWYFNRTIPNSFVYYRPKDIVSGDFYWAVKDGDNVLVCAADCTGHGVPGAFMSMISISALNKIVKEKKNTNPSSILNMLRRDIIADLAQDGIDDSDTKDGLDIALINIDYKNNKVMYSGAYNSLYIVRKEEVKESDLEMDYKYSIFNNRLIEIKADRMPIGISERLEKDFSTRSFDIKKGDFLVMTTDGYIDQFGGEKGKKLMSRRFKEILINLPTNDPKLAYEIFNEKFLAWRGNFEQIDDVLVIGIFF